MTHYFLRHADKAKGNFYDPRFRHHDQPISELGREQAARVAEYFSDKRIDGIFVSEYVRTSQTVRPLAERLRLEPRIDARLNEIDVGTTDGLTDGELREKHPDVWDAIVKMDRDFRWPGGESGAEAQRL